MRSLRAKCPDLAGFVNVLEEPRAIISEAKSALLAGLIVALFYLNPRHNPDAAQERAALVLDTMVVLDEVIGAARDLGLDAPLKKTPSLAPPAS